MVVNYDLPLTTFDDGRTFVPDIETYIHRVGRTGRAGARGMAVNFVDPRFRGGVDMRNLEEIEDRCFGKKRPSWHSIVEVPDCDVEEIERIAKEFIAGAGS